MLIIGEKLSIIAKRVREAMMKKDKAPIQEIAVRQWKEGSGVIDANIGPAEDEGENLMQWMVTTIQEVVPLPVCLDTTNFKAIEAGLKVHNNEWGRPLINSTSNDPERFPILELGAKYNSQVIGLTVGKGGLPADAEERAAIAAEIMGRAMEYGVPLEDLFLDPLVLQIATSQDHARHVIKAIAMFQEMNDPPMKTVVGLSNISNGCPKTLRPILNKYYFLLLADAGLTAAIADAHEMAEAVHDKALVADVLAGKQLSDTKKMAEISKTLDVIMGRTLYAHSYLEM
jgi:5-methyltetrahydrofolate corrinoid/iron sulfur protein methyltransferase